MKIHDGHGTGDSSGPDHPDCPCRGGPKQEECAQAGCGFCRAACLKDGAEAQAARFLARALAAEAQVIFYKSELRAETKDLNDKRMHELKLEARIRELEARLLRYEVPCRHRLLQLMTDGEQAWAKCAECHERMPGYKVTMIQDEIHVSCPEVYKAGVVLHSSPDEKHAFAPRQKMPKYCAVCGKTESTH